MGISWNDPARCPLKLEMDFINYHDDEFLYSPSEELTLLEIFESKLLGNYDIAMAYNPKTNVILSPFHKSITNLFRDLHLYFTNILCDVRTHSYMETYSGRNKNELLVHYRIEPVLINLKNPEGHVSQIEVPMFQINPEVLFYSKGFEALNLKCFAEAHAQNKFRKSLINLVNELSKNDRAMYVS